LLLDGEAVAFDRKRVSRFQLLQNRKSEPVYAVFDCLYMDGRDLRRQRLSERRASLEKVIQQTPGIFPSARLSQDGFEAYRLAQRKGYEGVLAKEESAAYIEGRSSKWLKFKVHQEDEFVIAGYTAPAGSRLHFGALLLGAYDRRQLRYVGKVGTGFSRDSLARLFKRFQPLARSKPSLIDPPRDKGLTHLAPRLVAQIAFQEWTADRKLRQPVFLGLRDDKHPEDVHLSDVP
jgi:bifunctional non-homologous end joining protein LigD